MCRQTEALGPGDTGEGAETLPAPGSKGPTLGTSAHSRTICTGSQEDTPHKPLGSQDEEEPI